MWVKSFRTLYEYNSDNKLATETFQQWNSTQQAWANVTKYEYTYSSDGLLTQREEYQLQNTEGYVLRGRNLYTYDSDGKLITEVKQVTDGSTWYNDRRRTYCYAEYKTDVQNMIANKEISGIQASNSNKGITIFGLSGVSEPVVCRFFDIKGRMIHSETIRAHVQGSSIWFKPYAR